MPIMNTSIWLFYGLTHRLIYWLIVIDLVTSPYPLWTNTYSIFLLIKWLNNWSMINWLVRFNRHAISEQPYIWMFYWFNYLIIDWLSSNIVIHILNRTYLIDWLTIDWFSNIFIPVLNSQLSNYLLIDWCTDWLIDWLIQ